jgi:hypothetical protein
MSITACTDNYYVVDLVGYVPGTGTTVGNIETFDTPTPVWTNGIDDAVSLQCQSVALGGFNGLNN